MNSHDPRILTIPRWDAIKFERHSLQALVGVGPGDASQGDVGLAKYD